MLAALLLTPMLIFVSTTARSEIVELVCDSETALGLHYHNVYMIDLSAGTAIELEKGGSAVIRFTDVNISEGMILFSQRFGQKQIPVFRIDRFSGVYRAHSEFLPGSVYFKQSVPGGDWDGKCIKRQRQI